MFQHECHIDDAVMLGDRLNPLNGLWLPWCLVCCKKCKKLQEWQVHSEEYMHGGALELKALPGRDYVKQKYQLEQDQITDILIGKRKPLRLVRKDGVYVPA